MLVTSRKHELISAYKSSVTIHMDKSLLRCPPGLNFPQSVEHEDQPDPVCDRVAVFFHDSSLLS